MLAEKNEYLQEAAETMFRLTAEEQIRKRCRDREEYYQDMRNYERYIAQQEGDLTIAKRALTRIEDELSDTRAKLSDAQSELSDTQSRLSDAQSELSDTQSRLSDTQSELSDTQAENTKLLKIAAWAKEHGYTENI